MCVCELMEVLNVNQPCVSQHLRILKYYKLLKAQREGKWILYQIDSQALEQYFNQVRRFLKTPLARSAELKAEYRRFAGLADRGLICSQLSVNSRII
jgi:ArsR family transcriptional regulator